MSNNFDFKELLKDKIIKKVVDIAKELDAKVYLVGGAVRDYIYFKKPVKDYDFVVTNEFERFHKQLRVALNAEFLGMSEFKTVKLRLEDGTIIDVARSRVEEYYKPGALPVVRFVSDIKQDLKRRDFTINAMAISMNPFGELIDPFGGLDDLKNKKIKVIYAEIFTDDPTRAFRAVRYKIRFGFEYDEQTKKEFENAKEYMSDISFERVKNELKRYTLEDKRVDMFYETARLKFMEKIVFNTEIPKEEFQTIDDALRELFPEKNEEQWIYFFLPFINYTLPIGTEYGYTFTKDERRILENVMSVLKDKEIPEDVWRMHKNYKKFDAGALIIIARLKKHKNLEEYIKKREKVKLYLTGNELMELGVPRGRLLGEYKDKIFVAHIQGLIKSREDEIQYVKELLAKRRSKE